MSLPQLNQKTLKDLSKRYRGNLRSDAVARQLDYGLTPRQKRLSMYWSIYRGTQYDQRKYDWNGSERNVDMTGTETVVMETYIPNGFATVSAPSNAPLSQRRPPAPYRLPTAIVHKFTAMLFGEGVKPRFTVEGDPAVEDWLDGAAEAADLWQRMRRARNIGGATGTCVIMPAFIEGRPSIEIFDPRFCFPTWLNRRELKLDSLEYRYMYSQDEWNNETNVWAKVWYWYRRVIDKYTDTVYKPLRVDADVVQFEVASSVKHPFGECPVIWTHNTYVENAEDGDCDFWPAAESFNELDTLNAQGRRGIKANCDPTLALFTDKDLGNGVKKGSENALLLSPQDKVQYLEIMGTGPAAALVEAKELRREILEVCQCVLDQPDSRVPRTATEIQRVYMGMISRVDDMRGQYGDRVLLPLARMWIKGANALTKTESVSPTGEIIKYTVTVPPKKETDADGKVTTKPRVLPDNLNDDEIHLKWPPYFQATPTDLLTMVQAASEAVGVVLDDAAAIRWIAPAFGINDADALVDRVRTHQERTRSQEAETQHNLIAAKNGMKKPKVKAEPDGGSED